MASVPVPVTRRPELELRDAEVRVIGRAECLGADDLLVAHRGVEGLTRRALPVPTRDLLVPELARLAVRVVGRAVRVGRILGPEARVEHPDDDVLADGLLPEPARPAETEERRCRRCRDGLRAV